MTPVTREELYFAYLGGDAVDIPDPVTRRERYLYDLCMKSGTSNLTTAQILKMISDAELDDGMRLDSNGILHFTTG